MAETDPVATAASRPLTLISSIASLLVAASLTVLNPSHLERPAVMAAAFFFLAATCVFLIRGSNEMRGSFTTQTHVVVVLLSWTAASLSTFAQWPNNEYLRDDWGPYVVAITLIATSPYRPLGSLIAALGTSAVFVAGLAILQSPVMTTALPGSAFALLAAAPVVLLATAGIVYARVDVSEHVGRVTDRPSAGAEVEPVKLTTQEKRVMLLTGEVAPLFSWVVQRRTITADDVERAAAISAAVRATMVHDANQSWIACATAEAIGSAQPSSARPPLVTTHSVARILAATRVWDASDLSARMSFEQRTVVRALLEVIFTHDQVRPESFAARVLRHGHDAQLWIDVSYGPGERGRRRPAASPRASHLRKPLGSFVAVARTSFSSVNFTTYSTQESLKVTLRFSYGL